jgi:hypothetical protein
MAMAGTPKHWGHRFTSQVWGFFKRTFRVNPSQFNKSEMTRLLRQKRQQKEVFGKLPKADRQMLSRLVDRQGRATKLWKGHIWGDMKDNTAGRVRYSKKGNPYLRYGWTRDEEDILRRNISRPKVAYSALGGVDSPHSFDAVRRKAHRLRKEASR